MKLYVLFGMLFMTFQTHSQNAVKITFMPKFDSENLTLNKVYYFKNDTLYIFGSFDKEKIKLYSYINTEGDFLVIQYGDVIYKLPDTIEVLLNP